MVLALHTLSGRISDVSPKMLQHPHFSKYLVPVEDGAKPYNPEMYHPGTVEEKLEESPKLFRKKKNKPVEDEIIVDDELTEEETHIEEDKQWLT